MSSAVSRQGNRQGEPHEKAHQKPPPGAGRTGTGTEETGREEEGRQAPQHAQAFRAKDRQPQAVGGDMAARKKTRKKTSAAHRCAVTLGRLGGKATARKRRASRKRTTGRKRGR